MVRPLLTARAPDRSWLRVGPIGPAFFGFALVTFALFGVALAEIRSRLDVPAGTSSQLGVMAATLFGISGVLVANRGLRARSRWTVLITLVLLGPGALWCWVVFVGGTEDPTIASLAGLAAAGLAVALLIQGLRAAHWLEIFTGLGSLALLLVTAVYRVDPASAGDSAALALLALTGATTCLYGILVDMELADQRTYDELLDSKRHVETEMVRAEEILHDLRSGLLAIEAAIASFDGELVGPLRAEAARLRRLTVRGQRSVGRFDLADQVRDLVSTRRAGGAPVDLRSPSSAQVWGEETEVLAIVENLLSNAERHGQSSPILIEIAERPGTTSLSISNGGPTLPASEWERAFEPGVTTHPDGSGIGLGRAKMLAGLNSASLAVRPTDNGRTTFVLDLCSEPPIPTLA